MCHTGLIFDIERFAIHDGPGIRTTVFLKGCPLHCLWCHNPESQHRKKEVFYSPERCLHCGLCVQVCLAKCHQMHAGKHEFDRTACLVCGRCVEVCYAGALEMVGREMTAEEVLTEVMKDKSYYDASGGGLTLSGGEPLAQPAFVSELLAKSKAAGLHTCLETSGYAPWEQLRQLLPLVDLFLYDVKATDPELHRQFTGQDNKLIRENLYQLNAAGAELILRCPLIPGVNDDNQHLEGIAALADDLSQVREVHLLPYHPLGVDKSARLGKEAKLTDTQFVAGEQVEAWLQYVQQRTRVPVRKQ